MPHSLLCSFRTTIAAAFACALGSLVAPSAGAQSELGLAAANQDGVVYLRITDHVKEKQAPGTERITGTGLVVSGDPYILTAKHLFLDGSQKLLGNFSIQGSLGSPDGPYFEIPKRSLIFSDYSDFALIKPRTHHRIVPMRPLPLCWDATPAVGAQVFALGFSPDYETVQGEIRSKPGQYWHSTLPITPGFSGGPVFSDQGVVIGISYGTATHATTGVPLAGLTAFSPLQNAMDFLNGKVQLFSSCVRYKDANFLSNPTLPVANLKGQAALRLQSNPALPFPGTGLQQQMMPKTRQDPEKVRAVRIEFGPDAALTSLDRMTPPVVGFWVGLCTARPQAQFPRGYSFLEGTGSHVQLIPPGTKSHSLANAKIDLGYVQDADLEKVWACVALNQGTNEPVAIHADDAGKLCKTCPK